jgi:hypothetical protein
MAAPPHSNIPLALWPRPLMVIFLWPYSRATSRRYSFGLMAVPPHGDISFGLTVPPPHGNISFGLAAVPPHGNISFGLTAAPPLGDIHLLFTSRRRLTAILFIPPRAVLTAIIFVLPCTDSFSPASRRHLTAILFNPPHSCASWRFFNFRLMAAPNGDSFYPASWRRLMAILLSRPAAIHLAAIGLTTFVVFSVAYAPPPHQAFRQAIPWHSALDLCPNCHRAGAFLFLPSSR